MSSIVRSINSAEQMETLGHEIGLKLKAGDLLVLRGELGAGKTTFTRGLAQALGIEGVTSPTFVISKIYPGRIPLVHVDAYRLIGNELALFDDLDLESRIPQSITVIEWGGDFVKRLVDSFVSIDIEFGSADNERVVRIEGLVS
jgi:tRNA threonylcarbamoyl adenosine modification protein YjeE